MLIGDALEHAARQHASRPAIVFDEDGSVLTYEQLRTRSRRLGHALASVAREGERVAVLSQNRPEYVEAYWAASLAGVALSLLNQRLKLAELVDIVTDAEPSVVLVEAQYLPVLREVRAHAPCIATVVVIGPAALQGDELDYEAWIATFPSTLPERRVADDALALLIYTSGTTGRPKGAMLSHRGVQHASMCWLVHSAQPLSERNVSLMPFPLCHIAGIGAVIDLCVGSTLVLQRGFAPEAVMAAIERHRVTRSPFAPTMLAMLLAHEAIERHDLSSLRFISYGSASMPLALLQAAMRRFPDAQFCQGFGMTETSGNVLCLDAEAHRIAATSRPELLATAGRPSPFISVRLVDDHLADVAPGEPGEILVKSESVMLGYWRRPDANAEVFVDGWYRTGDMGVMSADGYISIVDRKKDMIITGGENVYSREVEDALLRHPDVAEAAVVGLPDPHWGEVVCAVIVAKPGAAPTQASIVEWCRNELAGYKKPREVVFLAELPRTASGKAMKRALRDSLVRAREGSADGRA